MKLNAPTFPVWVIAVVLGVLGFLATFMAIPFVSAYAFWFVFLGFAILAIATAVKGL